MTKSIFAILAVSVTAAACGGSESTQVSAASAPPAPAVETAAPPAPPAAARVVEATPVPVAEPASAPRESRARASARPAKPAARVDYAEPAAASAAPARAADIPEYREFTLPAGTSLSLELKTALGSDVSQVEDAVRATLRESIRMNGHSVLPAGTEVVGTVLDAERAGRVKGRARIAFQFTSLRHDGERLTLRTEPIEQLGEATKGEDATKIGVGAGAGAVIGGLLGGKAGAAKGAVIGGAAGTGAVMATRGKEVRLEPGAEVVTTLSAPLSVRVRLQ